MLITPFLSDCMKRKYSFSVCILIKYVNRLYCLRLPCQVVSRGNIVTTGEQEQYFNLHVFNQDDTAVLTLQEGGGTSVPPQPPPVGNIFDQSFLAGGNPFASDSELMREIEREIAQERLASQTGRQEAVPDPYAGRTPVEEDFIEPIHYQPLGNKPALSPNPYAGRTPVEEDFIQPKHYQPLGNQQPQSPDPYAGRAPVEEDFIQPEHFQPLGARLQPPPADSYAGRTPVEEDPISPKHYQPLQKDDISNMKNENGKKKNFRLLTHGRDKEKFDE